MGDIRTSVGVALAMSLGIMIVLGFFAATARDFVFVFFGFAAGVVAVYLLERLKVSRAGQRPLS